MQEHAANFVVRGVSNPFVLQRSTLAALLLACCTPASPSGTIEAREAPVESANEEPSAVVRELMAQGEVEVRRLAEADGLAHYKNGTVVVEVTDAVEAFFRLRGGGYILMTAPSDAQLASLPRLRGLIHGLELTLDRPTDLSPLDALTELASLEIVATENAPQLDLTVLDRLTALTDLAVRGAPAEGLQPFVVRQQGLTTLRLDDTTAPDFAAVVAACPLAFVFLRDLEGADLVPLGNAPGLRQLHLARVQSPSYDWFRGSNKLESIELEDLDAALPFVCDAPELGMVTIVGGAGDLTPLQRCRGLAQVHVSFSGLTDLTPLAGSEALWVLDVGNNPKLASLEPLRGHAALTTLRLYGTAVRDIAVLGTLPALDTIEGPWPIRDEIEAFGRAHPRVNASARAGFERDAS